MPDARAEILGRIRAALADVPTGEMAQDVPVVREHRLLDTRARAELVGLFAERVHDYRAQVRRVPSSALPDAVRAACAGSNLRRLVVPGGVPDQWLPSGVEIIRDGGLDAGALDAAALDGIDGALTGCAAAIAETGTLMLDGGSRSGRRALTLVPDHHICIVEAEQVYGQVPEAFAAVEALVRSRRAPITLVSGPSASSDIELERVEGVHGPRHLFVLIAE